MNDEWFAWLRPIRQLSVELNLRGSVAWYRGQANTSWPLRSTLHREVRMMLEESGEKPNHPLIAEFLREQYKANYQDFRSNAWSILRSEERDLWGVIFAMQHYGFPTRLFDWTESFLCALHFAQEGRRPSEDAAIFVLDPHALNKSSLGQEGIISLSPDDRPGNIPMSRWHPAFVARDTSLPDVALIPLRSNARMLAQGATFVACGDGFEPLEDTHANAITKIVLPARLSGSADEFLAFMGVTSYTWFPDYVGLERRHRVRRANHVRLSRELRARL